MELPKRVRRYPFRNNLSGLTFLLLCAFAVPAIANPAIPAEQSKCEIQANKFKARHPHADFFNSGFLPFGVAVPPKPPWSYFDPESGITLHVERDGRHLAAVDRYGKLLWNRNPFVDDDLCPYRSAHPFIAELRSTAVRDDFIVRELNEIIPRGGKIEIPSPHAYFISLSFNSSQDGWLNVDNGDFYLTGQN
jgi:hypothetical protein